MPWIAGTALLHSAVVMEKREALKVWTILLAILAFSLSLLGTFLVRSGVLTSVHAFATDPTRGIFILAILVIVHRRGARALRLAGLGPQAGRHLRADLARGRARPQQPPLDGVLRGGLLRHALPARPGSADRRQDLGRAAVLRHDVRPVDAELLLVVMPFGPFLAWKRGDLSGVTQRLGVAIGAAILVTLACWWVARGGPALAPLGLGLAAFVMLGALSELSDRIRLFREPPLASLRRLAGLPRSAIGTTIAHFGMGVTLLGVVGSSAWQAESVAAMQPGETVAFGRYHATFEGSSDRQGPNYTDKVAHLLILKGGEPLAKVETAKRFYPARQMPTTEAGIETLRVRPGLCLARRRPARRRRGAEALRQAADHARLARLPRHGRRRRALPVRPTTARRCAEACAPAGPTAGGGMIAAKRM